MLLATIVATVLEGLKGGAWLTRRRMLEYGTILLLLEVAGFLFFAAGTHGLIVPLEKPNSSDFVSFYAAGSLANAGTPSLAYDAVAIMPSNSRSPREGSRTTISTILRSTSSSAQRSRGFPTSPPL